MRFRPVRFSALPVIATIATVATAPAAARAQSMAIAGAPTPDSLARLVMARFSTGVPDAFDSVYVDPLGRDVVRTAVQQRQLRRPDLERVVWRTDDRAVLLLSGTVYPARERPQPLDATAGSDETNRVLTVDLGGPYGFAARFNNAARIASLTLDGRPVEYGFGGGILWFPAKRRRGAQLVLRSTLVESRIPSAVAARDSTRPAGEGNEAPAFGAYHNTDAWLPFFNYDSGNSFAQMTVTARIPAAYRLTTSLPQAESVDGGIRTVRARSLHPQFLVALAYDRDWRVESSSVTTPVGPLRVETFLTPDFRFTHDSLAKVVQRVYAVLARRFGEPQAPTRYLGIVANRALGRGGFAVRMNNLVVGGSGVTRLDDPTLGTSYVLAHETSHGWTMNASGPAANMLQEGWATFAEGVVLRDVYGVDAERALWERQRASYMTGVDRASESFDGHQSILASPDNGRIHYVKGSWVFRALAHTLGDAFDRGIRDYVALRRAGGAAGYEEFVAAMTRAARRDMAPFIRPWLAGTYIPDVDARVEGSRVIVAQTQPEVVFDLPLDLAITTSGGRTVWRTAHLTGRADTVDVRDLGAVTDVRVDPDHWFLLQRHYGEVVRFELPVAAAPDAKVVELLGNVASKPIPAVRSGDMWVVALPMSEGRYIWQWRVDGALPNEEAMFAAVAGPPDPNARSGVKSVRALVRGGGAYPKRRTTPTATAYSLLGLVTAGEPRGMSLSRIGASRGRVVCVNVCKSAAVASH